MAYTQAHNKANQRYQLKAYDRLYIRVRKGKKELYTAYAEKHGESLAGIITRLLDTEIAKDGDTD